jgi:hypothetical protein
METRYSNARLYIRNGRYVRFCEKKRHIRFRDVRRAPFHDKRRHILFHDGRQNERRIHFYDKRRRVRFHDKRRLPLATCVSFTYIIRDAQ